MEATDLLTTFPGSKFVCRVCFADATDAYCEKCTRLTEKKNGRPVKWTECNKCGEHYLGVNTSKRCLRHCDGKRVICEVQPAKKPKPKKTRPQMVVA